MNANNSSYLDIGKIIEKIGVSKSTIDRWMKLEKNPFPKPAINQRGKGCLRLWSVSDVERWENNQCQ